MEPYVGIVVFELTKQHDDSSRISRFYREDFVLVYADSEDAAKKRVRAMADAQASTADDPPTDLRVTVRHIIDVAPALDGRVDRDCDLYCRHFASVDDYKRFEMMLGGTDPLDG